MLVPLGEGWGSGRDLPAGSTLSLRAAVRHQEHHQQLGSHGVTPTPAWSLPLPSCPGSTGTGGTTPDSGSWDGCTSSEAWALLVIHNSHRGWEHFSTSGIYQQVPFSTMRLFCGLFPEDWLKALADGMPAPTEPSSPSSA